MGVLDRFRRTEERAAPSLTIDEWASWFSYLGSNYVVGLNQTLAGGQTEEIASSFVGITQGAYKRSGIVFACEMVRVSHFAQARFIFRDTTTHRLFTSPDLALLQKPWTGGTTGDLMAKMLAHADLAGNAFVVRQPNRLKILRPDWMTILIGSPNDSEAGVWDPDSELLGYLYHPGGYYSGRDPVPYLPQEVAHFAPQTDPEAEYRGMSWLQPVITDIMGDQAATTHKLKFFENGATPNMVIGLPISDPEKFQQWVDLFNEKYAGASNAYKTMFLAQGADAKVVGADFNQIDFKQTVGVSETRIAAAAGVPPVVVGLSEGLQGSSLNAGNYNSARRRFADGTLAYLWQNVASSLAQIITVPPGAELWYDTRNIPFMREDAEVQATVTQSKAAAARQLVDGGWEPDSVVDAVESGDFARLIHSGNLSVQLQPPGADVSQNGQPALPVSP